MEWGFLSCISPVVTLICGTDLICYNSWYRKAARTAREEHRFLPAKSRLWLQILERAALLLTLFGILVRALLGTGGSSMGRLYLAAIPVRDHAVSLRCFSPIRR